jgi:hypothetical protein
MDRTVATILLLMLLTLPAMAGGERRCGPDGQGPYGDYCPGPRSGWYGSGATITSTEQAKKALQDYFGTATTVVVTGEKGCFFEAEVRDGGKVTDRVIIHKKNGRIRSIY